MAKLRKNRQPLDLDLTSFSDIANLLIIFFILTTSLSRPWGREINMPSAAQPPTTEEKANTPTVNIFADRITLAEGEGDGKEMTMDELRADLLRRNFPKRAADDRVVVIEAAEDATYERYYQVATAVAAAGGVVAVMEEGK